MSFNTCLPGRQAPTMRGFALLLILVSSVASAQIKNYKLGDLEGNAIAGVSVAISPKNNKNMVAYAAGKMMISNDAGVTWTASQLNFPAELKGTPNLTADSKGNFFIVYSTLTQIITRSSTNDGKTWSEPMIVSGPAGKDQYNPNILTFPKREGLMVTWTQAGKLGLEADSCKSNIMLATSTSGGKKWSKPIVVNQNAGNCLDEDFTVRGSTAIMDLDNRTFVVWASQGTLIYDRSYDGQMWISTDLGIAEQSGGWGLTIPGFGKIANTPAVAIDNSPSRIHGTLFLAYSDLKSGENDSDIWLVRSVNRGDNWTVAARVNQDKAGRDQFLPRISIDPANGRVYILYYDRRDGSDNQTDVYLAWSTDGGNQFKETKITEAAFASDINVADYMTDYIDLSVQKGIIVPVWTSIQNGKQEVWTAVIRQEDLK